MLGLPRSRTAWLANWLTTDTSLCMHDAWRFARTAADLRAYLLALDPDKQLDYIGTSDSSSGWRYAELKAEFPEARFALIERPVTDVTISALDLGCVPEPRELIALLDGLYATHQDIKDTEQQVLATSYDSLDEEEVIRSLQRHLLPNRQFSRARFDLLTQLKVTIHAAKYKTQLNECVTA